MVLLLASRPIGLRIDGRDAEDVPSGVAEAEETAA
jgi:hypothetical protein